MLNELRHLPPGAAALSWALGCAFVCYRERVFVMIGSLNNVARWLLSIEMAVCLVPLTGLFIAVFATAAHGHLPLPFAILAASAALLGPIGLAVGSRIIFVPAGAVSRATAAVMALLAAWTVLACFGQMVHVGISFAEGWRDFVMIAVLPAWAVVHLLRINAHRSSLSKNISEAGAFPTR